MKRLLIANRGEVAVRIMRACRELGIESVAVYSDADASALHVGVADRAVRIGPAVAAESYLSTAAILHAAQATGADAIHPGYGFLAEDAAFAAACERAGLVFVGPPSDVMATMGSKIAARRLVQEVGLPVVPGEAPVDQSDDGLRAAIERVGLPALVKAAAGGGGKGMRRVQSPMEAGDAVRAARREAIAAFGDGTLYVERFLEGPRHIEIQIFGDAHGNIVHLFERDCSAQRRHQKVVEESPAPSIGPRLRGRIVDAAVRAARAAGYQGAGTVEFLVDRARGGADEAPFYFLEMNTRLQVEHGVTEQVVGVDLVHAQLRVASGATLPWAQSQLTQRGHAIEARVYAEDPAREFLPQAGRILLYQEPRIPGVRVDSGVAEGHQVSVHYDPLLAKVVAHAERRDLAIERLLAALRSYPILGIQTNIPFLVRVLDHPRFRAGEIDVGFLDGAGSNLAGAAPGAVPSPVLAAVGAHRAAAPTGDAEPQPQDWDPWRRLRGWRV